MRVEIAARKLCALCLLWPWLVCAHPSLYSIYGKQKYHSGEIQVHLTVRKCCLSLFINNDQTDLEEAASRGGTASHLSENSHSWNLLLLLLKLRTRRTRRHSEAAQYKCQATIIIVAARWQHVWIEADWNSHDFIRERSAEVEKQSDTGDSYTEVTLQRREGGHQLSTFHRRLAIR